MIAKHRTMPVALAFAGVLALACATGAKAHDHDSDDRGDPGDLAGTWKVQITLRNCTNGAPVGAPFYSLLTFADGGTMTETTANSMFFPAIRGPGHGVWSRGRHKGEYSAATTAFITMDGALVKTQTITQIIDMGPGPDRFTTPKASVEFFDPAGNLLTMGCATAVATRFGL
jgi:hypothetical protein